MDLGVESGSGKKWRRGSKENEMKLIVKNTKPSFDKGVAAGLGYIDEYFTENGSFYASIYGGDMSSPSVVKFADGELFKKAGYKFESLPLEKEAWELKKRELLSLEKHEKAFALLDVETGKRYFSNDPVVYGGEIIYNVVAVVEALRIDGEGEYTLFTYQKVNNLKNKIVAVHDICEKSGYFIDSEMDSCYNYDYFICKDDLKGHCISYETYDSNAIRYEVLTGIGEKIWKAGEITEEIKQEIEEEIEEARKKMAAAAAAKKKYAAKVFSQARELGLNTTGIPSIRALSVLINLVKGGLRLPPKTKARMSKKAYAWAYLEDSVSQPVWRALEEQRHLTFEEALWVLVNLPDPS